MVSALLLERFELVVLAEELFLDEVLKRRVVDTPVEVELAELLSS